MPKWDEITRTEKYQNLPPESRAQVKTEWFKANLLPEIENRPSLKEMGPDKVYEWFMQQPDDTGQGYVTSLLGSAARGFGEVVPGAVEGVGAVTGIEGLREAGQGIRSGLESITPVNPLYQQEVPMQLAGVGGQIGSVLATGGVGGALGKALGGVNAVSRGAQGALLGSAFLQGAAEGRREAEQYGMEGPEAYLRGLTGGAIEAGTEFLPFGMAAETALAKRMLAGAPKTSSFLGAAGSEFGEEGLGKIASNIATQTLAPTGVETPGIMEGALENALYGAAGGAMLGGINALIPSAPKSPEIQIAAETLNATTDTPFTDISGQAAADAIAQNTELAMRMPIQPVETVEEIAPEVTPSPAMEILEKPSQTITGSNGEIAPEMPVPVESEVTSSGEAPIPEGASMPMMVTRDMKQQLVDLGYSRSDINAMRPEEAAAIIQSGVSKPAPIQPITTQEDAIQEQIPDEGVLRQERPEMELQGMGERNIQPEEVAGKGEASEEVALREGVYNLETRTNFAELPASVRGDRFVLSPATGMVFDRMYAQSVTPPAFTRPEQAVRSLNESRYNADVSLPVSLGRSADGADIFTSAADLPPVVIPQQTPSPPTTGTEPTTATEGKVTPGGVATERDLTKPEQMTPEERRDAKIQVIAVETEKGLKPIYYLAIREGDSIGIYGSNYRETDGELIGNTKPAELIARPTLAGVIQVGGSAPAYIEKLAIDEGAPIYRANGIGVQAAHQAEIASARLKKAPVSKAAVDAYGITLPEGYVRQGDLYVFQPPSPPTTGAVPTKTLPAGQKVTPGGVATERDLTKPKPLTDKELPSLDQRGITESGREIEARFSPTERMEPLSTPDEQRNLREAQSGLAYGKAVRGEPLTQREVDSLPVRLPEGYVKQGDLYVFQPQTTAAETQTSGVATERDLTKPEQMTPEEYKTQSRQELDDVAAERDKLFIVARKEFEAKRDALHKKNTAALKRISRLNPDGNNEGVDPNIDSAGKRLVEALFTEIAARKKELYDLQPPSQSKLFEEASKKLNYKDRGNHRIQIVPVALAANLPVSKAAVDAYGITLPEGYVQDGELYVYRPRLAYLKSREVDAYGGTALSDAEDAELAELQGQIAPEPAPPVQRDVTKPEQMTPEEYITPRIANLEKDIAELEANEPKVGSNAYLYWQPKLMEAKRNLKALKEDRDEPGTDKPWAPGLQQRSIFEALEVGEPVSAAAVDAYKITLPEGYVRQGDLYVFQPQTTKAAAETQTPESVGRGLGGSRGVQSEPSKGSILEVEKESTKTAIESTGKSAPSGYGDVVNSARKSLKDRPDDFKTQEQVLADLMKLPVADLQSAFEVVTGSPTKLANKRQLANNVLNELLAEAQDGKPTAAEDTFRKAEQEAEEEIQRQNAQSISNLFDKLRTNPQRGQVTQADVNQAIGALQNSGEVPNAIFTWNGTTDDLLRQRATMERQFPGAVAAASMPNVEGVFENGMAFVFSNRIVVTDLDRRKAAEEGISPGVAAVKRVVTHENMHKGLWLLSPKQQSDIMSFLRQMFPAAELDELAKSYRQYADWRTNPVHEMALLDERLQKYIEETKTIPTDGVWKQFWDYIKEIWRKLTGKPKGEPTLQSMKDVVRLIRSALKNAHKARPDRTIDGGRALMSVSGGRSFVPAVNIDGRVEIGASHYDAWIKHALRQIPNFKKDGLSDEERRQLADRWIVDHPEFMAYSLRKEGFVSGGEFLNRQDSLKKFKSLGGVQQMAPGEPDRDWLDASDVEGYRFSYASEQDEASSIGQQTARYAASSPRTIETIVGVRQAYASMPKSNGAAVMLDDLFAETAKLVPNLTRPEFDRVVQGMYDDNAALLNDAQNPSSVTILPGAMMSMAGGANDAEYLAAVEAGDMEKAQRMVDEAAKAAALKGDLPVDVARGIYLQWDGKNRVTVVQKDPRGSDEIGAFEGYIPKSNDRPAHFLMFAVNPNKRGSGIGPLAMRALANMGELMVDSTERDMRSALSKVGATKTGEDEFQIKSADPVTYDDAGNVIPLSQRFQTTSPDIRFSIASTPEQQSAAAKFKSAITAAAKGLPDLREYEGRLVKAASGEAIDVEPHNVLWFYGFMKASEQLLSDLQKQGLSLQQIYDKVAMDTEFKRELGLFDEETGSGQAATILSSLLTKKTFESARKAKTKEEKLRSDTLHRKAAAYYYGIGTVRGQNLVTLRLLQNDPRTRYMFMEDKVTNEMLKKAEHGVNVQFGDGYAATQEAVKNAVDASAEAAKTEVADAVENAAEEDQDAIDLAEGEATLKDPEKSLYEEYKDLLREEGILARLDKEEQDMGAKMSISPERRSELANLTKEERAKLREKNKQRRMEILSKLLGREEDAKTPEQKTTRKKREKMVKTAQKRAEKGQDIDAKATEQAAIEIAENKASQIVYRFEELYRQGFKNPPEGMSQKQQKDSIIKAFREQVKNPASFEVFAERLENLKVGAEVAERLFLTASRERADLIRMKGFKAEKRKVEIADKQASRLIYSTEEKLRQGSKDLNTSKDGDSINKAFREQVESPMSETAFVKRLAALNVSAEAAARLFKTAAREKADQEAMLAYELLSGLDAFKKMAREVNAMRPSAEVPFMKRIPWRKIFRQPGKTVEEYRQNIFNAVNSNEAFKDLDEAQKRRLSELFAEAWQAQRDKILKSMIEQHTYSLERQQKKEAAKALRDARNQIIEAVNLGAFSNDELTRVLGEKFGFKTSFTEDEKQKLSDLAEKLQDEKLNKAKRNKLAREFLSTLQSGTQIPIAELLSNWWVSAVLSGGNTVSAIALSFLNGTGIGIMGTHLSRALRELMKGNTANAIDAITSLFKAYAKHISSFPTAANRAWQYLWSGDVSFLESAANDPFGRVNTLADIAKYQVVADQVAKDPNKVKAVMGRFMQFMGRLLTALDAFNVMVTKAGTVSLAIRQSGLTPEQIRDAELKNDLKFYKDKIVREDPHFGGKQPTSAKEKAYLSSLAEAEMYADLAEMGVKMENADYLASESAMTMNPTGVGGIVYNSIKALDTKVTSETEKHLDMAQVAWAKSKNAEDAIKLFTWSLIHFLAKQSLNVFGLRFARFAGNKFNQSLSFVPGLGLLRMIEADNKELAGRQEAFKDTIIRNQTLGWILMFAGWSIIKAIEEEPDDEKRGWFLNGGWSNLTPDQKKQKISRGEKPYTIGTGDYVFNYQNWPISQPLAALGALSDLVRYSQDKWKAKTAGGKAGSAVISGMQAALQIPALTQVNEIFANTMASKDPAEQTASRLSRVTAGWMGGFMPRILKDLDYMQDPTMRRYETLFQKAASHVPVYRRYVGSDYYDILGNKIEKNAIPGSRDFMKLEDKPEYRMLGALNARGIWLTPANAEYRMVGKGRFRRRLTQEEADRYSLETGKLYRQMVMNYGPRALQMPVERAKDYISAKADDMRDLALQRAVRN